MFDMTPGFTCLVVYSLVKIIQSLPFIFHQLDLKAFVSFMLKGNSTSPGMVSCNFKG